MRTRMHKGSWMWSRGADTEEREWDTPDTCASNISEMIPQKSPLMVVATGEGSRSWERGQRPRSHSFCTFYTFNYPPKKLSQNVSRLHPTSFPPSTKGTGEPQERLGGWRPLKIVDMLAGVVRRLYEVSRAPNVGGWGEACQEFWKHREHWDKVNGTMKKQPDESRMKDMP